MESVRTDRFWSCGLTPRDAAITKSLYYPGENNLGRMLDSIRDALLSDSTSTSYDEDEPIQTTSPDSHQASTSVVKSTTLSLSDSSLQEVTKTDAGLTPHLPRIQLSMQMHQSSPLLPASPQNHCHIPLLHETYRHAKFLNQLVLQF